MMESVLLALCPLPVKRIVFFTGGLQSVRGLSTKKLSGIAPGFATAQSQKTSGSAARISRLRSGQGGPNAGGKQHMFIHGQAQSRDQETALLQRRNRHGNAGDNRV
jgi:hypothetical protein